MKNNDDYKASANLHRTLRIFNVDDYVMVRMRPERFPSRTVKKLHARVHDRSKSSGRSIQMLMWWISYQTLASVALLMLRTSSHIEVLLILLLIHLWMSLLRNLLSESPHYLHFLQNYPVQQKIEILSWTIRLSLLEMEVHDAILLSEKKDQIQKILGKLRTFNSLTPTYWSIITVSSSSFPPHTRQDRVLSTLEELMKTSHRVEDDSIDRFYSRSRKWRTAVRWL